MTWDIVILIFIVLFQALLGVIILFSGNKDAANIKFAALVFSIVGWSVMNFLSEIVQDALLARIFVGLTYVMALLGAFFFFQFSLLFPYKEQDIPRRVKIFIFVTLVGLMALSFSPFMVKEVFVAYPVNTAKNGILLPVFILCFLGLMAAAFVLLEKKYRNLMGQRSAQIRYIFIGSAATVVGASMTNLIIPLFTDDSRITRYGPYFTIFLVSYTAYAILKHKLFNIKIIAAELLTFVIWFVLFFQTLLAESFEALVINGCLLFFVIIFGIFLIRGVIKEVEEGEKLEALSRKLEKANEQLEELDKMKSRFLSFASHQVKTPMTAIKGYACLIYYNTDRLSRSKIKQMAGKMKLSTDRTISLVNNLLDLRKIEEGRMQYTFEPVILAQTVREIIEELRLVAQEKGLYLVFETPAYEGTVEVDAQKMREVLQNLVENSIKYTDRGWVRVTLKEDTEGNVIFLVKDSGRGIAPAVVPHLFREYERGSAVTSAIQGTGLGLFIAKQIISDHSGKIWAESAGEGKGSSFFAKLPIRRTHA